MTDQPTDQLTNQLIDQPMDQPTEQPTFGIIIEAPLPEHKNFESKKEKSILLSILCHIVQCQNKLGYHHSEVHFDLISKIINLICPKPFCGQKFGFG